VFLVPSGSGGGHGSTVAPATWGRSRWLSRKYRGVRLAGGAAWRGMAEWLEPRYGMAVGFAVGALITERGLAIPVAAACALFMLWRVGAIDGASMTLGSRLVPLGSTRQPCEMFFTEPVDVAAYPGVSDWPCGRIACFRLEVV